MEILKSLFAKQGIDGMDVETFFWRFQGPIATGERRNGDFFRDLSSLIAFLENKERDFYQGFWEFYIGSERLGFDFRHIKKVWDRRILVLKSESQESFIKIMDNLQRFFNEYTEYSEGFEKRLAGPLFSIVDFFKKLDQDSSEEFFWEFFQVAKRIGGDFSSIVSLWKGAEFKEFKDDSEPSSLGLLAKNPEKFEAVMMILNAFIDGLENLGKFYHEDIKELVDVCVQFSSREDSLTNFLRFYWTSKLLGYSLSRIKSVWNSFGLAELAEN